eukprot:gene4636-6517_t
MQFLKVICSCAGLLVLLGCSQAKLGVDLSIVTNSSIWDCLVKEHSTEYAIIRAYRSLGQVDANSANSLRLAHNSGVKDLGVYMFPCITSSNYAKSNNITCDSAEVQVEKTLQYLHENEIYVEHSVTTENDARNPVFVNKFWIDVEDEDGYLYYDPSPEVNLAFLADLVGKLNALRVPVGIYTKTNYWTNIMGGSIDYGKYPLWYPRYDATDSLNFFVPFSGWSTVAIKQTGGDVGYCGLTQVDSDYSL